MKSRYYYYSFAAIFLYLFARSTYDLATNSDPHGVITSRLEFSIFPVISIVLALGFWTLGDIISNMMNSEVSDLEELQHRTNYLRGLLLPSHDSKLFFTIGYGGAFIAAIDTLLLLV